jgi:hypothetical protein
MFVTFVLLAIHFPARLSAASPLLGGAAAAQRG